MPDFYQQMQEPQSGFGMLHDVRTHVEYTARKIDEAKVRVKTCLSIIEADRLDREDLIFRLKDHLAEAVEILNKVNT